MLIKIRGVTYPSVKAAAEAMGGVASGRLALLPRALRRAAA